MTEYGKALSTQATSIPGLTIWDLPVHGDNRGWFKENWQREKMHALGLPDFGPVQNNVSFNETAGTTRGIHAEPWDKFISVASGRVFGAWVDLRAGPSFGASFTTEIDPSRAVFVPRGVGNAFQTLEDRTSYVYLVNDHYSPSGQYVSVNVADPTLGIRWPISLEEAEMSSKDQSHPPLVQVSPIQPRSALVVGANGQLGRALRETGLGALPIEFAERTDLDVSSPNLQSQRRWRDYEVIINAAAYTAVDAAESDAGRLTAWSTNVAGAANLAQIATSNGLTLIQVSSDYVFDGSAASPYGEHDRVSPLSVYGQTKAAADHIVQTVPRHYVLRTSWVIGDGNNFVRTMLSLGNRGINPRVVDDQFGRLTFSAELARAIRHLLEVRSPYGIYNITNSGQVVSWARIAQQVFEMAGFGAHRVYPVRTREYAAENKNYRAVRPSYGALDLSKIVATGFTPTDYEQTLRDYVNSNTSGS